MIMPMFVCDVVDLCVMFSLICMSSGGKKLVPLGSLYGTELLCCSFVAMLRVK